MKFCVGITTYNRLDLIERMSSSLNTSNDIELCNIRIYDDKSSEISLDDIKSAFPNAKEIIVRDKNLGADRNMYQMFLDFLDTQDDYLFVADSDLIFHPEWFLFFKRYSHFDILSLYNSVSHKVMGTVNEEIIHKLHIGAAGTIFKRNIVKEIIENVPPSRSYDWDWSNFLVKKGYHLNVSKRSYVQHIGIIGTNNDGGSVIDFGLNFLPGNAINEKYLIDFFQHALISKDEFIKYSYSPKIVLRKIKSAFKILKWKISNQ
ncbi:glycosyltransferase family 2 protein [Chryseobacterium geocarposphaerae]|uniref:Glycosyl transferase family 2 n=1 Tax=Chryseobacterium geocarposphaerae TaxID=1416776 RepID=A0A2M9CAE0_9FLAO|nr:glycosyltransferase family 2 protein [Chryseobacterium geocarposphaerae]PJJ67826.1 glycosyl transferase family 2 [Chryseobacterium geocarposphaerae]